MERVTTLGNTNATSAWIDTSSRAVAKGQEEVSTGVRFTLASELPADAAALLRNQRSLSRLEQFERNHANARQWLETTDTALVDAVGSLTHGRTRAVHAANDLNTPEAKAALAGELRAVADELLSIANTTINGRPIFAGTSGAALAYDDTGTYLGDGGQVVRTVGTNESFVVAAGGPAVFGTFNPGDPLNGSAFQMLDTIANAIEAGDVDATRQGIEAIDAAISRVQLELGRLGNLSSRLDAVEDRNERAQIASRAQISDLRDVDMGEAILRLRAAETSHEATLSAAARSLGRSLLDFLR
ncbi:MAG: flagellin [Acidimicrobiia bacterium]|nr:flagellin [Acidimicrobiia bacterium]